MISAKDIYHVLVAIFPLYVAMLLAYLSVKWWKLFSPDQCSGINKFVAKFTVPFLSFQVISANNIYKMNPKIIYADLLQKVITFVALAAITKISSRGGLKWIITGLSLSTLPNTLVVGIPLLKAMYGEEASSILAQIVVLQSIIWYNILLILFELNKATKVPSVVPIPEATVEELERQESHTREQGEEAQSIIERKVKTKQILLKAGEKLLVNPNTYATLLGLIWSSVHFRWEVKMPEIIDQSIQIMTDGGLGMSMFSLGLFTALQPKIIACGARIALVAMVLKFIIGPAVMAASSLAMGLGGTVFKVALLQAALPQATVPFVFAKEYNVHPEVLSTGVLFGMIITLPVSLAYYFLLASF